MSKSVHYIRIYWHSQWKQENGEKSEEEERNGTEEWNLIHIEEDLEKNN